MSDFIPDELWGAEQRMKARPHYVYRVVVDSWPTDDGEPFINQDRDFWDDIVDCASKPNHDGNSDCECPWWLPSNIGDYLDEHGRPQHTHWVGDDSELDTGHPGFTLIWLPAAPGRRFLSRTTPAAMAKQLRLWGCKAHVERAACGGWEATNA